MEILNPLLALLTTLFRGTVCAVNQPSSLCDSTTFNLTLATDTRSVARVRPLLTSSVECEQVCVDINGVDCGVWRANGDRLSPMIIPGTKTRHSLCLYAELISQSTRDVRVTCQRTSADRHPVEVILQLVPCEEDPSCGADTDDLTPANLTDPVVTIEVYGSSPEPTSTGLPGPQPISDITTHTTIPTTGSHDVSPHGTPSPTTPTPTASEDWWKYVLGVVLFILMAVLIITGALCGLICRRRRRGDEEGHRDHGDGTELEMNSAAENKDETKMAGERQKEQNGVHNISSGSVRLSLPDSSYHEDVVRRCFNRSRLTVLDQQITKELELKSFTTQSPPYSSILQCTGDSCVSGLHMVYVVPFEKSLLESVKAVYNRLEVSQSKPAEPTSITSTPAIKLRVPSNVNEILPDMSIQTTTTPTCGPKEEWQVQSLEEEVCLKQEVVSGHEGYDGAVEDGEECKGTQTEMRKRRGPPVRPSSGPPKPSNLRTKTQTTFRVVVRAPDIKWKPFKIDPEVLQRELIDVTASYLPCHPSNDNDKSNNCAIVCSQVIDHNDFIRHHSNNNDTTPVVVYG